MRHRIVTRIILSLVALWVVAVGLFAWGVTRPAPPPTSQHAERAGPTGEALFARHCAMCHEAAEVGIAYRETADREASAAAFREFLVGHHGPSPEGIVLIVSHVLEAGPR